MNMLSQAYSKVSCHIMYTLMPLARLHKFFQTKQCLLSLLPSHFLPLSLFLACSLALPFSPSLLLSLSLSLPQSDSSQDFPMLNELILLAYGEEVLTDAPLLSCDRNLQDKLIQDCMWSGHLCEKDPSKTTISAPLNLPPVVSPDSGVYSPASSPPPPPVPTECDTSAEEEITPMQTDCISPSAVFPTLLPPTSTTAASNSSGGTNIAEVKKSLRMAERFHKGVEPVRRRLERERYERRYVTMAMTGGNGRVQPQAESSTSGEGKGERERERKGREEKGVRREGLAFVGLHSSSCVFPPSLWREVSGSASLFFHFPPPSLPHSLYSVLSHFLFPCTTVSLFLPPPLSLSPPLPLYLPSSLSPPLPLYLPSSPPPLPLPLPIYNYSSNFLTANICCSCSTE